MSAKVQRLRVRYVRGDEVRYVSHLDMMRFWERALRRAHIPVAYSEGFTPHPQIAMCAPLSVGMTSRAELLDVFLAEQRGAGEIREQLQAQVPRGMTISAVSDIPVVGPALQAQVRAAVYALQLRHDADLPAAERAIRTLLAAESIPWEHRREKDVKHYDLRPLVLDLRLESAGADTEGAAVVVTLRADEGNTGRPDQLAAALGIAADVANIERLDFILAEPAAATV